MWLVVLQGIFVVVVVVVENNVNYFREVCRIIQKRKCKRIIIMLTIGELVFCVGGADLKIMLATGERNSPVR